METDNTGNVISYEEYHPFGTTAYQAVDATIKAAAKRYKYTGKERDDESGFYYHGVRYYMPWVARWLSVDPLAHERVSLTPYNAMSNNPINRIDPTGALDEWVEHDGKMEYDNRVTNQEDATALYFVFVCNCNAVKLKKKVTTNQLETNKNSYICYYKHE